MANPSEVAAQVRFALAQVPRQNAHHEFEHICRHLAQQSICSNILPATGPVSGGGDQGRDFETFRTYLRQEIGPHGAFLGLASEIPIAFVCTTQANNLATKLRDDIRTVCASGHSVGSIHAFTLESVSVATRHTLQAETQDEYGVYLELHDAESIASLLSQPQGFWIAERFLSIPAEIRPDPAPSDGELSDAYVELRQIWREKGSPDPTLGDFIDVKTGLREATWEQEARSDLPFWLALVRDLLASPNLPVRIVQRARYELVIATFRGTHTVRPVDDLAREYLTESLKESEPVRLQDASALLMYVNTAVVAGITSFTPYELEDWNDRLTRRVQELIDKETPHNRATLLFTLGHLGIHPAITKDYIPPPSEGTFIPEPWDLYDDKSGLPNVSMRDDMVLIDTFRAVAAWTELMEDLDATPLFPLQTLADIVQLLLPLWSNRVEWRTLLDRVDEALGQRLGKHALATRARDRAMRLLQADRHLDALEEFHDAKIDWWSGETVHDALLAMSLISRLYLQLWLPQASKSYALAVAYVAASSGDDNLADLVPSSLLIAAKADFAAGVWCSATELYELGLEVQHEFIQDGTDWGKHKEVEDAITNLVYIDAASKLIHADLADSIDATIDRLGAQEFMADAVNNLRDEDVDFWASFGDIGLIARPFSDLGKVRHIRFSALGTDWTVLAENDVASARIAERFAAGAQVMLAALARNDLCLVETRITVRVQNVGEVHAPVEERIKSIPNNDEQEWAVQLAPARHSSDLDPEEHTKELFAMLTIILRNASLLSDVDFYAGLGRAFERGLGHKLTAGRPYDELVAGFTLDPGMEIPRARYNAPWKCDDQPFRRYAELRWQNGVGPTYSSDKANELLRTRYLNLTGSLRITAAMLASSDDFQRTVEELRARGWLDWHILTAIFNIVVNYRFREKRFDLGSEETMREMIDTGFHPESATAEPVPISAFTPEAMNDKREVAMMALLRHWGLELRQRTPNIPAIERLLADRYGYWDEDVPHDDPFPDSMQVGSGSGLVVISDARQDEA